MSIINNQAKQYTRRSDAVRAAKKLHGEGFVDVCTIVQVGERFEIQTEVVKSFDAVKKDVEVIQQLADIQADADKKVIKAKEIKAKKPVHIPANPISEIVAAPVAPIPTPVLPAFLQTPPPAPIPVPADDEVAAMQAAADQAANVEAVNSVDPLRPRMSTTALPTKKVWTIADSMMAQAGGMPKRKEVIEECVRQGIAYGTARTQYQHWFKCINDSLVAPLAVIGADGKITMTNGGDK